MNKPLILKPEAVADLAEITAWYNAQRPGLGNKWLDGVREVFTQIRRTPELYPKEFQDLRLASVRKYPYIVVYRVNEVQITIVAVYHARRDPRGWQERMT